MRAVAALLLLVAACSAPTPTPSATAAPTPTPTLSAAAAPTPTPTLSATAAPTPTPTLSATAAPTLDPGLVVMAAGDIACDPADPNFNSGAGTSTTCRQADTARLLVGADLILALGDTQYECGGLAAYLASFDRSWGAFKARIRPAIGNHEENGTGRPKPFGTDCDAVQSAAGYYSYFGSAAPARTYSFDARGWHFATVDSTCNPAKCAAEASWLSSDLAAHPTACSIVFYHHPRWSSGRQGNELQRDPFWLAAAAAGVDIVLGAHDHDYERFAPMDASGAASAVGVREFVVGTGGYGLTNVHAAQPNSERLNNDTFGVLKLTLRSDTYEWQFIPIAGQSFTDAGAGSCH